MEDLTLNGDNEKNSNMKPAMLAAADGISKDLNNVFGKSLEAHKVITPKPNQISYATIKSISPNSYDGDYGTIQTAHIGFEVETEGAPYKMEQVYFDNKNPKNSQFNVLFEAAIRYCSDEDIDKDHFTGFGDFLGARVSGVYQSRRKGGYLQESIDIDDVLDMPILKNRQSEAAATDQSFSLNVGNEDE